MLLSALAQGRIDTPVTAVSCIPVSGTHFISLAQETSLKEIVLPLEQEIAPVSQHFLTLGRKIPLFFIIEGMHSLGCYPWC